MATGIPSPALPLMTEHFAGQEHQELLSRFTLQFISIFTPEPDSAFIIKFYVLSVAALFIVVGSPIAGRLSDRLGRRPVLITSIILFGISGAAGYFIDSLTMLLISRAILGFAAGGIRSCTIAIVGDLFSGEERNKFLGLQSSIMKWGTVIFLFTGSFLTNLGWRPPFLVYLLSFVILPLVLYSLHESLQQTSEQEVQKIMPPMPWFAVSQVLLGAFIANVAFFTTPVEVPFFVRESLPYLGPSWGGISVAIANTMAAIFALAYFWFKARLKYSQIFGVLFVLIAAGYYLLHLSTDYSLVVLGMILAGIGFGLILPNQSAWVMAVVDPAHRGYAVGLVTTAMYLGQFMTPIITQFLDVRGDPHALFLNLSMCLFVLGIIYIVLPIILDFHHSSS